MLATFWRRLLLATILWALFWPILWYIKIGDISGPKSWFWIVGELNYPFAAVFYAIIDRMLAQSGKPAWKVFLFSALIVVIVMLFFYQRIGFSFGVLAEAYLF